jgi:hypothetical protein
VNRRVRVAVDGSSWPANQVPAGIRRISPSLVVSVESALLGLALCTRPPRVYGFDLADLWAWLRYIPAIDAGVDLKLRPEWNQLDAHQKTILSDDFGVALSLFVLRSALDITYIADTRWVIQVILPGQFGYLAGGARRGPKKAPDYFFVTKTGDVGVLECKGSQTNLRGLKNAMRTGAIQKRNVLALGGGQPITHAIVSGVFVPNSYSPEPATVLLRDPPSALARALSDVPKEVLGQTVRRVNGAQALALAGLAASANAVLEGTHPSLQRFEQALLQDMRYTERDRVAERTSGSVLVGGEFAGAEGPLRYQLDRKSVPTPQALWEWYLRKDEQDSMRIVAAADEARIVVPFGLEIRLHTSAS